MRRMPTIVPIGQIVGNCEFMRSSVLLNNTGSVKVEKTSGYFPRRSLFIYCLCMLFSVLRARIYIMGIIYRTFRVRSPPSSAHARPSFSAGERRCAATVSGQRARHRCLQDTVAAPYSGIRSLVTPCSVASVDVVYVLYHTY